MQWSNWYYSYLPDKKQLLYIEVFDYIADKDMKDHLNRVKRYNNAIRKILSKEWDPIGIKDVPQAQSEYDSYIPQICKLLINHESSENIFQYLWKIETDYMGLCGNQNHTRSIAKKLADIVGEINGQNT